MNERLRGCGGARFGSPCVELCSPLDEFGYTEGSFGDESFGGGPVDDAVARLDGVFKMKGNVLFAFHGDSDSALCVVGIGLAERFLGDDEDIAVAGQLNCGTKPGNTCAHDQKINLRGPWHLL